MKYTGKWIIAGSYNEGEVQDFELQFKKELPGIDYREVVENDIELQQELEISPSGEALFDAKSEKLKGEIKTENGIDILYLDGEKLPIKIVDDYLVFDIIDGYAFKKLEA